MGSVTGFLRDPSGAFSSKRLFGLACFAVSVALALRGADWQLVTAYLTAATGVFIGQAATGT